MDCHVDQRNAMLHADGDGDMVYMFLD